MLIFVLFIIFLFIWHGFAFTFRLGGLEFSIEWFSLEGFILAKTHKQDKTAYILSQVDAFLLREGIMNPKGKEERLKNVK